MNFTSDNASAAGYQRRGSGSTAATDMSANEVFKEMFDSRAKNGQISLDAFSEVLSILNLSDSLSFEEYCAILAGRGCKLGDEDSQTTSKSLITPTKMPSHTHTSPTMSEVTTDAIILPAVAEVQELLDGIKRGASLLQKKFESVQRRNEYWYRLPKLDTFEEQMKELHTKVASFQARLDNAKGDAEVCSLLKQEVIVYNRSVVRELQALL